MNLSVGGEGTASDETPLKNGGIALGTTSTFSFK
jgi:hypothetical protein